MNMRVIPLAVALVGVAGCATHDGPKIMEAAEVKVADKNFPDPSSSTNLNLVEVRKGSVYFGSKALTVRPDDKLPPIFDDKAAIKALAYERSPLNILELAERITRQYRIPVEINQNVYLASATLPTQGGSAKASAPGDAPKNDQVANFAFLGERIIQLNDYDSLRAILDRVAVRIGVSWEYADGKIQIFRYKTRTFDVMIPNGPTDDTMKFSTQANSQSGNAGQGGSSSSQVAMTLTRGGVSKPWDEFVNEVAAFRSAGGSVTANPTAGTITVTDTPAVLARIETFIKEFNRRAGRQVALKFDYYSIKRTRANQLGLEVNGVFTTPNGTVRTFLQSPGSLLDNTAALAQGNVLPGANKTVPTPGRPGTIGDGLKNGEGSSLGLGAVASWDDAVRIGGYSLIAKNNVSQAFTESDFQEYPRSISSTQSNTSTETQIQQGSITTGFAGYFLARITDDNRVNLRFGMDISDPPKLSPTSAGNTTIQSASVSRKAPVIDVLIVPGRPVPILQMTQRKAANRTNLGFGGSTTDNDTDSDLLLVVTATLLN